MNSQSCTALSILELLNILVHSRQRRSDEYLTIRLNWVNMHQWVYYWILHTTKPNLGTRGIPPLHRRGPMHDHRSTCMCMHRIAGIFRGYKCSRFLWIRDVPQAFITPNLISHACMLQKRAIPRKLNPWKPFWRHFRENLYPRNIPAIYGIHNITRTGQASQRL